MAISPASYNIRPQRRADYPLSFAFEDSEGAALDLTGYTVSAQVWNKDRSVKYGDFVVDASSLATGRVDMVLPYTVTTTLPDQCYYDVLLVNGSGLREYYVEGIVRPSEGYTA